MRTGLLALDAPTRAEASAAIRAHIAREIGKRAPRRIAIFFSSPREPDLRPLADSLAATHELFAPRVNAEGVMVWHRLERRSGGISGGVRRGAFGVGEPDPDANPETATPGELEMILVPGVAFDARGVRLGRGGGHFDRTLAEAAGARKIGVAFGVQIVTEVPREPHDVPMNALVTEGGVRECTEEGAA